MPDKHDSVQFSITRISDNQYKIIVQNDKEIIRSYEEDGFDIGDAVSYEIDQLAIRP